MKRYRRKYCCHWCNIKHLNDLRTPAYNAAQWAKYYRENHERLLERARDVRTSLGRDRLNELHRNWYHKDPTKIQAIQAKRRANKFQQTPLIDNVTLIEWECLVGAWGNSCAYCGATGVRLTQDHVVPISKGGFHSLDNLLPACKSCNTAKKDQDVSDFLVSAYLERKKA